MIWLDGLDLPMYRHFPVHFVEHFKVSRWVWLEGRYAKLVDRRAGIRLRMWIRGIARLFFRGPR